MNLLLIGQGYIGSYLTLELIEKGHTVTVCSTSVGFQSNNLKQLIVGRYQDLDSGFLNNFDAILWFAGHSSVKMSIEDPDGAVRNNCFDLLDLAQRKPDHIPMYYASTASLYSIQHDFETSANPIPVSEEDAKIISLNPYDSSKAAFDALTGPLATNTCGLRLGTVCGYSPKLREELVFNAMNISALRDGFVKLANPHAWRSLLFLDDLLIAINFLLDKQEVPARFINLASMDIKIGELAEKIAKRYDARITILDNTPTYSFRMSTELMTSLGGAFPTQVLEERCDVFRRELVTQKEHES